MIDQTSPTSTRTTQIEPARKLVVTSVVTLLKHKWLIIWTTVVVTAVVAAYLFTLAKVWYRAEANVVPARKPGGLLESLSSGISSTIKDLGLTPLAGRAKADGTYSPLTIASSRTVQEKLVKEFGFMKLYDAPTMEDACKEFGEHASVEVLEEGNVSVSFEDTDPNRAAAVANRLVDELNTVNSDLAMEEARFNRTYIENRYKQVIFSLDSTDHALGEFQRKYGVYELKTQASAQLAVLGSLEQQRYIADVQLANAEQLYGSGAPEANAIRTQLAELRRKAQELKTGMDSDASSYFVPTNVMPDVALEYLQLMRDEEILTKLKAFLLPSYEQAQMDETKQTMLYLALDKATPPTRKSRPKRATALLLTLLSTMVLTSIVVLSVSSFRDARARFTRDRNLLGV